MANDIKIIDAILEINSNAEAVVSGTDIDNATIQWLNGTSEISKADIKTKMNSMQTTYDNNAYARKRATEYPSVQDFMEAYTEKEIGGDSTKWDAYKTAYNKVRTDNPKE
jgi:hypothetical protein